jgi:hypothetical protein
MDNLAILAKKVLCSCNISNLMSGVFGAIIGTFVSSAVSIYIYRRKIRFESNRYYLDNLIKILQDIYLAVNSRSRINDDAIRSIDAFQVVSYDEFNILQPDLDKIKKEILLYRDSLVTSATISSTDSTVAISQEEIQSRKTIEGVIKNIMKNIRAIT